MTLKDALTRDQFDELGEMVADDLDINPRSIATRGSAHFGFSLSPKASRIWRKTSTDSDLDIAIIDPHMYSIVDREVRRLDRDADPGSMSREEFEKFKRRQNNRKWQCYRWTDFPSGVKGTLETYLHAAKKWSDKYQIQFKEGISAFFYYDWWCFEDRNIYDLEALCAHPALPTPPESPRPRDRTREEFENVLENCPEEVCGAGENSFDRRVHLNRLSATTRRLWLSGEFTLSDAEILVTKAPNLEVLDISETRLHSKKDGDIINELLKLANLKHVCVDRESDLRKVSSTASSKIRFFKQGWSRGGVDPRAFFPSLVPAPVRE